MAYMALAAGELEQSGSLDLSAWGPLQCCGPLRRFGRSRQRSFAGEAPPRSGSGGQPDELEYEGRQLQV